jgi:trigger factor
LKVTKEKEENRQAFLTIEMEPAEMEEGMQHAYEKVVQKTTVPGFRKGKAPRSLLERHVGRSRLLEEALDHMIPQAYEQALKEQTIEPYAQPELEITQADPLIFKAVVPMKPTVEIGDYKSIRMTPETVEIKDENIDSVIENLRHQNAVWEPVDRPLDYNDMAVIDVNGTIEDRPYYKRVASQLQVDKDMTIPAPGFADEIVGLKKDGEKEFKIKYPEDYPGESAAGKEGLFKVKLHEIKEEKLPELNDEFAGQVSTEFKTLADLREEVIKSLRLRGEERARMDFEEKVINSVVEQAKLEYPPVLVNMEIERLINEQSRQLQATGQGMDQYLQSINKTAEQLQEELRPVATRNVNASLVLSKISTEEKIEVSETDIENGINNMTRGAADERQEEMRKLLDTPQNRESIKQSLKTRKTIERLTDIAKNTGESPEKPKEETNEQPASEQPSTDEQSTDA